MKVIVNIAQSSKSRLLRRTETNFFFFLFQGCTISHPCLYCSSFLLLNLCKSGTRKAVLGPWHNYTEVYLTLFSALNIIQLHDKVHFLVKWLSSDEHTGCSFDCHKVQRKWWMRIWIYDVQRLYLIRAPQPPDATFRCFCAALDNLHLLPMYIPEVLSREFQIVQKYTNLYKDIYSSYCF